MTKTILLFGLLVCIPTLSIGQENKQPRAKLVREAFIAGDSSHAIEEAALDLKEHASGKQDRVAVRVCTNERLPVALSIASASPFIMLEYLEHYGFSRERVLLMRSGDCLVKNSKIAVTEFWAIPDGASPPHSVESIRSSQASLQVVRTSDTVKTANEYRVALQEVIAKLRSNSNAKAVVVGYYLIKPSRALRRNLDEAKKVIGQYPRAADRLYVLAAPSSGMRESNEPETTYPNLFVIHIARGQ